MFDTQHSKRPENDRSSAELTQESSKTKRSIQHTGDLTRIPLYAQAGGNQPPPWLRPGIPQQAPQERELLQRTTEPTQRKENTTGLPDTLKAGVEQLSGLSMDNVNVHYNSSEPSKLQALAYTQGVEIHVGPGQEQHLAHEVWHVAQQKQGRVMPTLQAKGVAINDDQSLEQEASVMGGRANHVGDGALQRKEEGSWSSDDGKTDYAYRGKTVQQFTRSTPSSTVIQMEREWIGLNAERYREQDGKFYRFDNNNNSWVDVNLPLQELISQYFGGMVRAASPPLTIADFVGRHVKSVDQNVLDTKPSYFQGIVGVWDPSLARTGHALGSGQADIRENQYGDGIYVIKPGYPATDYQHFEKPSIVYRVYAMKRVQFITRGDNMQTVYTNPQQFSMLCFVQETVLLSKRQAIEEQKKPSPGFDEDEYRKQAQKEGLIHRSLF